MFTCAGCCVITPAVNPSVPSVTFFSLSLSVELSSAVPSPKAAENPTS